MADLISGDFRSKFARDAWHTPSFSISRAGRGRVVESEDAHALFDTNCTRRRNGVRRTRTAFAKAASETGAYALVLVFTSRAAVALKDVRLPTRIKARRERRDNRSCLKNHLDEARGASVFDILLNEVRGVSGYWSGVNDFAARSCIQLLCLVAGEQNDAVEDAKLALDGAAQIIALTHNHGVIHHDLA